MIRMKTRAYSKITVKAVDDGTRTISGIATTPRTDRMGDVVEPMGAEFSLPISLLWQHRHDQPIGLVTHAEKTAEGIHFTATIADVQEPGRLKDRVDEAWQSLKAGLIRGVSIGFSASKWSEISTGYKFEAWEWLELSLVSIPANVDATIDAIKNFDAEALEKTRKNAAAVKTPDGNKAAGKSLKVVKFNYLERDVKYAEQLAAIAAKKAENAEKMAALMDACAKSGETLTADEAAEFDALAAENEALEGQEKRLGILADAAVNTAKAVNVNAGKSASAASAAREPGSVRVSLVERKEEAGVGFARYVKSLAAAQGNRAEAARIAQDKYGADDKVTVYAKAAVAAATTTDATWAAPLVAETGVVGDFLEFLRPQTIVGQFGLGNIPGLRSIPIGTSIVEQTSGGSAGWVGEGKQKPVTKFDFSRVKLDLFKVANIAVLTNETIRRSEPAADLLVRDQLAKAIGARLDIDFVDPDKAAVADESPASITNGVTAIPSAGSTPADILTDIRALRAAVRAGSQVAGKPVLIVDSASAEALTFALNDLGTARAFPDMQLNGGLVYGIPVIVSDYLANVSATGRIVVMVNADEVYLGDDGGLEVSYSREATLNMSDTPNSEGSATFNLWQNNCTGILAERFISWAKRRNDAVAWLSGVTW